MKREGKYRAIFLSGYRLKSSSQCKKLSFGIATFGAVGLMAGTQAEITI